MAGSGKSLTHYIDVADAMKVRHYLRRRKSDAPGWSHALHQLWAAYCALEADTLEANEKLKAVERAVTGSVQQ